MTIINSNDMKISHTINMNLMLAIAGALALTSCIKEKYLTYNHVIEEDNPQEEEVITVPESMNVGTYALKTSAADAHQTIRGLGFEIQSDSYGPEWNESDPVAGVPYELLPEERTRLNGEVLKGFRYMRLALGIWFRGLTEDRKNYVSRYDGQLEGLVQMMNQAQVEGISLEYWSPAPYWKSNSSLVGGEVKSTEPEFLDEFSDAMVRDIQYLQQNGMKVCTWGLQNEPIYGDTGYPSCHYEPDVYVDVFKSVAPKIKALDPSIEIILDSCNGNVSSYAEELRKPENSAYLQYVDAWVYHRIGDNSDNVMNRAANYQSNSLGKPIYNNEFEYMPDHLKNNSKEWLMVNTAQSIMNWMTFLDAPVWYWLHVLKPVSDGENRDGFGLGTFRGKADKMSHGYPDLETGHFTMQWWNWNPIAGFLKYMPWDSVRYTVEEAQAKADNRVMAWKTPEGKFVVALTNRSADWYAFSITLDSARTFVGHSFDAGHLDRILDEKEVSAQGSVLTAKVKPWSIVFLVEE